MTKIKVEIDKLISSEKNEDNGNTLWNISEEEWNEWLKTLPKEKFEAILKELSKNLEKKNSTKIDEQTMPYKKPQNDDVLELRLA